MSEITIETVETDSKTLRCEIACSPDLRRFFSGRDFRTEYSVDISDVPRSVLTVPVVAQVCPVAWSHGADVYVPTLDSRFHESLLGVKDALLEMYPNLLQGGSVHCEELASDERDVDSDEPALLFTGGVDSMFSFIRHRDEDPSLININGWALSNGERRKWAEMKSYVREFAGENGVDDFYIRSNMLKFLRNPMLIAHCEPHVLGAWYSSIGHGLGLLGLCAPLAHATGMTDLYMAATHWEGTSFPWGSRPTIVENTSWGRTEAHHDGYAHTRQERIEAISEYVDERGSNPTILSCSDGISRNCGRCEKCCRTAIAFLFAGADPNGHGLALSSETFERVREQLESGNWKLSANKQLYWRDLRVHAPPDANYPFEGAEEFVEWLRRTDFEKLAERTDEPLGKRVLHSMYRNVPYPVFNVLDSYLEIGPFTGSGHRNEIAVEDERTLAFPENTNASDGGDRPSQAHGRTK